MEGTQVLHMSDNSSGQSITDIHRMTKIIEFTRQLQPQPPKDSKPSWYLINTLGFFKGGKKVWEQEIPEIDVKRMVTNRWGRVELDHPGYGFHVEYDKDWGWLLKFKMTHQQAEKVWKYISDREAFFYFNVKDLSKLKESF